MVDLTGGEVKIIGNSGDEHTIRLSNPTGQTIIDSSGTYDAVFITHPRGKDSVALDTSEIADGVLIIPITIKAGFYRIRRLNPRRTLLTMEIEVR